MFDIIHTLGLDFISDTTILPGLKPKSTFKGAGHRRAEASLTAYRKAQEERLKNVCSSLNPSSRQVRRRLAQKGW